MLIDARRQVSARGRSIVLPPAWTNIASSEAAPSPRIGTRLPLGLESASPARRARSALWCPRTFGVAYIDRDHLLLAESRADATARRIGRLRRHGSTARVWSLATRRTRCVPRPWTCFQAAAVLTTLATIGAPKFVASAAAVAVLSAPCRAQIGGHARQAAQPDGPASARLTCAQPHARSGQPPAAA